MSALCSNKRLPGRILGTGLAVPNQPVSNTDIHRLLYGNHFREQMEKQGSDPEHAARHGFQERYWTSTPGKEPAADETECLDLMEQAARHALQKAGTTPGEVDLFIAFSTTPSRYTTSSAAIVGGRLGLRAASFEIRSGCSSAIHALVIAYSLMQSGCGRVLIAGAEVLSKVLPGAGTLAYAAGDAGAAVVLERGAGTDQGDGESERAAAGQSALLAYELDSDGSQSVLMGVPGLLPPRSSEMAANAYRMHMAKGSDEVARELWKISPRRLLAQTGLGPDDIAAYIPHQVNAGLLNVGSTAAGIADDRVVQTLARYANCGSVSVLINLHEALESGRLRPGQKAMLHAVGGGLAWGAALLQL